MKKIILIVIAFAVIGLSARGQTAYITNSSSNTVSVIDVATNSLYSTIPLPINSYPNGITKSFDGSKV